MLLAAPAALLLSVVPAPPEVHFHAGRQELVPPGSQQSPVRRLQAAAVHVRQQIALQQLDLHVARVSELAPLALPHANIAHAYTKLEVSSGRHAFPLTCAALVTDSGTLHKHRGVLTCI